MEALLSAGEWLAIVLGGLIIRFGAAVAVLAAIVMVLLPIVYAFEGGRRLLRRVRGIEDVQGFEWRRGPRYAPSHLWLGERGGLVRLGLDSIAARVLAAARDVVVPPVGTRVVAGAPLARFTAGHASIAVPAPFDGVVADVNVRLGDQPDLASRHPYGGGWLVELEPADRAYRRLPRAAEARRWFDREAGKLTFALEHATGYAAADGGEPIAPHHELLTDDQVVQLAAAFLGASVSKDGRS